MKIIAITERGYYGSTKMLVEMTNEELKTLSGGGARDEDLRIGMSFNIKNTWEDVRTLRMFSRDLQKFIDECESATKKLKEYALPEFFKDGAKS